MDLGAYAQIDSLSQIMKDNNIDIPRLRGLRLMKDEQPYSDERIEECARSYWLRDCELACTSGFSYGSGWYEFSDRTWKLKRKYLQFNEDNEPIAIRWDKIHGKKRNLFKYLLKQNRKKLSKNLQTFNKYCGRDDVLYIHARIGGANWVPYHGPEIKKQPWFLDKEDDPWDSTYCDIYAKIKPVTDDPAPATTF